MSLGKIAHRIDDLQAKSLMANSLQNALYISIFCQEKEDKTDFEWAFTLLGNMTLEISEELKELTELVFEDYRKSET